MCYLIRSTHVLLTTCPNKLDNYERIDYIYSESNLWLRLLRAQGANSTPKNYIIKDLPLDCLDNTPVFKKNPSMEATGRDFIP